MLNDYFVLVDNEQKIVIDKIQKIPDYWKNIAHPGNFSDEELKDLTWSGNPNLGWIRINSECIKEYSSSKKNLELNKNQLKEIVSKIAQEKQNSPIEYKGIKITPDEKTRYSFWIKKIQSIDEFNYKINNQYYTFNKIEIAEICDIIEKYIQDCANFEMKIYSQIDACKNLYDFNILNIQKFF
jgi:hypothetical protein